MLKRRIIPCLDVKDGVVVKGVRFRDHGIVGDIVPLAANYSNQGADELVFYDITASSDGRAVDKTWVERISAEINIPFCVAGGIRSVADAEKLLELGADKISINSPALETPDLIDQMAKRFGSQCVVIGIDSQREANIHKVYQYTGSVGKTIATGRHTIDWAREASARGAGEIVLNCMNQDGVRQGYELPILNQVAAEISIPLIASGGAGSHEHFYQVFNETQVSGALAASVFHRNVIAIAELKQYLAVRKILVRL